MKEEELAERGTPEFYREQVLRLVMLADAMTDPATRIELLDIAAVFQKLADRSAAAAAARVADLSEKKSA